MGQFHCLKVGRARLAFVGVKMLLAASTSSHPGLPRYHRCPACRLNRSVAAAAPDQAGLPWPRRAQQGRQAAGGTPRRPGNGSPLWLPRGGARCVCARLCRYCGRLAQHIFVMGSPWGWWGRSWPRRWGNTSVSTRAAPPGHGVAIAQGAGYAAAGAGRVQQGQES